VPGLAHHLLMLYGPDIPNFFRRAVSYADKLRIRSATINLQTSMLLAYGQQIAASALEKRLPTVYGYREHVIAGGLISYGVHHDMPPFSGRPSLTGRCGYGWTCSLPHPVRGRYRDHCQWDFLT
jgi:hypothetical protein